MAGTLTIAAICVNSGVTANGVSFAAANGEKSSGDSILLVIGLTETNPENATKLEPTNSTAAAETTSLITA